MSRQKPANETFIENIFVSLVNNVILTKRKGEPKLCYLPIVQIFVFQPLIKKFFVESLAGLFYVFANPSPERFLHVFLNVRSVCGDGVRAGVSQGGNAAPSPSPGGPQPNRQLNSGNTSKNAIINLDYSGKFSSPQGYIIWSNFGLNWQTGKNFEGGFSKKKKEGEGKKKIEKEEGEGKKRERKKVKKCKKGKKLKKEVRKLNGEKYLSLFPSLWIFTMFCLGKGKWKGIGMGMSF